jgi:hypothetical protein
LLVDTRIVYCGDNLDQLCKLPDGCVDLIYIDPPFNSNRNHEVFWGSLSEPRPSGSGFRRLFEDRHAGTQAYIDYMRPRCVELACAEDDWQLLLPLRLAGEPPVPLLGLPVPPAGEGGGDAFCPAAPATQSQSRWHVTE